MLHHYVVAIKEEKKNKQTQKTISQSAVDGTTKLYMKVENYIDKL